MRKFSWFAGRPAREDLTVSEHMKEQPPPVPNAGPDVWLLVVDDMTQRRLTGLDRYGTPLQPGNGRDALADAYAEALDLCVYLRQAIAERDGR
jgi:hypothetical protein